MAVNARSPAARAQAAAGPVAPSRPGEAARMPKNVPSAAPAPSPEGAATEKRLTKSPGRVTQMLELVAHAGAQGITLTELSRAMESPRTSLIGLLDSLIHEDYVVRQERGYRLGWSAFRLATAITRSFQLPEIMRPELQRLAADTGETVLLATFGDAQRSIVYLDKCESHQSLRFSVEIGTHRPLYCSSGGRAMLAHMPEAWQQQYLRSTKLERLTPRTIVDPKQIREKLASIRAIGYATTEEETAVGVFGVGAAILDKAGRPVAALAIAAPSARGADKAVELGEALSAAAQRISRVFGHEG